MDELNDNIYPNPYVMLTVQYQKEVGGESSEDMQEENKPLISASRRL
ncbi:MAG: hypothetical protein LBF67_05175 [Prevotellaceae bacterium]|jgi:hypothetical protein|nr:hypothetical protein [Prevotellaceae bacterium]